MKKTFTTLSIIALTIISLNSNAQVKLGVTAGTQLTFTNTDFLDKAKSIATPTVGIVAQVNLGAGLMFRPSVNYIQDGLKSFESITTQVAPSITRITELSAAVKIQSLQIPLDVVVGLNAGTGKFLISLAPVVTIGLNAKFTSDETQTTTGLPTATNPQTGKLDFTGANAVFERIDWGCRIGVGYEFKNGIQLNAAYKAGLNDIAVGTDKYKTNSLSLTLSYFLIK
jgi:Outer membrane protein beta-barrel domain